MKQIFLDGFTPPPSHRAFRRLTPDGTPCNGCPYEQSGAKVAPTLVDDPLLLAVGLAPGGQEEKDGLNFVGPSGQLLARELKRVGIPWQRVAKINLTRCRPADDDFEVEEWKKAQRRCDRYLTRDVGLPGSPRHLVPILALGKQTAARFVEKGDVIRDRGLWHRSSDGGRRMVFVARHPAAVLRNGAAELEIFRQDLQRMADRLFDRVKLPPLQIKIFDSPFAAADFLKWLAGYSKPWAFDTETYDVREFPSRKKVSTDACHEDFRVRGIGFAVNPSQGVYVDLLSAERSGRKREAAALLSPAFGSPAPKFCQKGEFDQEALEQEEWVDRVVNRCGDSMLGAIALGDGRGSNRLERLVVDLLGEPQWWDGLDKSRMRDHSIAQVAEGCVRDAAGCLKLCNKLHEMLRAGVYLDR